MSYKPNDIVWKCAWLLSCSINFLGFLHVLYRVPLYCWVVLHCGFTRSLVDGRSSLG
jgi:hypothetical protein